MMRGPFTVLPFKCNICCIHNSTNTPFISLNSQIIMISYNINHIFVDEKIYQLRCWKLEKLLFNLYFLNYDISLNNAFRNTQFSIHIDNIHMEGTVSQNFDLRYRFCFMICRKLSKKKSTKSSRFLS